MADITTLQELYVDELKDLWSANDQLAKGLKTIVKQATNDKLRSCCRTRRTASPHIPTC